MNRYRSWRPYVSAAKRRSRASKEIAEIQKSGRQVSPVEVVGRKIATTFWGEAWCKNLEAYSDYANRLPRGRTYVRNGSVVDCQIETGCVRALVSGSKFYDVRIEIKALPKKKWNDIRRQCAGQIDSLIELLQGSISKGVMEIVTQKGKGLFPSPGEISLGCSCPDWATMCKHVAATLYGVGTRLDDEPELLFTLRGVDPVEMVETAVDQPKRVGKPRSGRVLDPEALSSVFGVDIDSDMAPSQRKSTSAKSKGRTKTTKKSTSKTNRKKSKTKSAAQKPAKKKPTTRKTSKKTTKKKTRAKKPTSKKTARKKPASRKKT